MITIVTIVLCHNSFATQIACSAAEALSLRDQLKHGEHCPPEVYLEYKKTSWDEVNNLARKETETQIYCDVCDSHYGPYEPCPYH